MVRELHLPGVHKGREVIYSCLSRAFMEMPSESIFKMLEDVLPHVEGAESIVEALRARRAATEEGRRRLDDEALRAYTRIFCLTDSAATSESVYLSPSHLTMQEQAGQVSFIYEHMKFDISGASNEPPDHISHELMFMSYLAKATAGALEKGSTEYAAKNIELQAGFLDRHIMKWAADFAAGVAGFKEAEVFYGPLAGFMVNFLNQDRIYLSE